jgi:O-antigen ligase
MNVNQTDTIVTQKKASLASRALFFLLCFSPVLATLAIGMVDALSLGVFTIGAALVGWLWLADAWSLREFRFSRNPLQLFILGLILIGAFQLLPLRSVSLPPNLLTVSVSQTLSLDAFATKLALAELVAMLIYFAAALSFINTQRRLRTIALTIVIFGFALAIFGIIQHFTGEGKIYWLRQPYHAIPFGPFVNRHHFAACMEMTMGLTLGLLYFNSLKSDKRLLLVFFVIAMGVSLILTGSRGALISLFGVLAFLTFAKFVNKKTAQTTQTSDGTDFLNNRAMLFVGGIALILTVFGSVLLLGSDDLLMRSVGANVAGDFTTGRKHFWFITLQIIRDYPIFGVGLDAFAAVYPQYDTWNGLYRLERAHNDYLQIFAETGIIGFALTIGFLALLFRQGLKVFAATQDNFRRGVCLGALGGCFGVAIHSFFDFPLRTPSNLLMFLTLAALAVVSIEIKSTHRKRVRK